MRTYELNGNSFEADKDTEFKIQRKSAKGGWSTSQTVKGDVIQAYDKFTRSQSSLKRLLAGDKEVARA